MFSDEMKAERGRISRELLERFEKDGEDFLKKIITGNETWVHHYDPENKRQSMEYRHKESPHTYLLTPWSRVLLEKLTGSAAGQEIPRFFGTRRFITVLTSACHLSLS